MVARYGAESDDDSAARRGEQSDCLLVHLVRPPGSSLPASPARSITGSPIRSFTDPPGLKNSALAYTGVRIPRVTLFSLMRGVQPIVSSTLSEGRRCRSFII